VHSPTDIPDDAPGRVEFYTALTPPDILPAPAPTPTAELTGAPSAEAPPATASRQHPDPPLAGWLPVGILAVAMVLIFILGLVVTR
jgi:hypothetical protein